MSLRLRDEQKGTDIATSHPQKTYIRPSGLVSTTAPTARDELCRFCEKQIAQYSCPRCNSLYCSLTCYKSERHRGCTESFYKHNVEQELKLQAGIGSDSEDVRQDQEKLVQVLNKFDDEGSATDWQYELPADLRDKKRMLEKDLSELSSKESELSLDEEKDFEEAINNATEEQLWTILSDEQKAEFLNIWNQQQSQEKS